MPTSIAGNSALPIHHTLIQDQPKQFRGTLSGGRVGGETTGVTLAPKSGADAVYESQPFEAAFPFNELLVSWNVAVPAEAGMSVEARVAPAAGDWSPWLYLGDWGSTLPSGERNAEFPNGRVHVDVLKSTAKFARFQYRIRAATTAAAGSAVHVDRIAICVSDTSADHASAPSVEDKNPPPTSAWQRRLPVPFRSQKAEDANIAGRICSPTSLSMVMEYYGRNRPTAAVAQACFDSQHNIYGHWPRNVQAAFQFGVPGYLTRLSSWEQVQRFIADGRPLIASIRVANPGDLKGAPYQTTDGHLIVVCGFDRDGNVEVNDPAAADVAAGQTRYSRIDLEKAWFRGSGGVAYVLLPPSRRR